jgi:hypothetical protein
MTRSRRALILAVAGFVVGCGLSPAQAPASRPASSPSRDAMQKIADRELERVQKLVHDEPEAFDKILAAIEEAEPAARGFPRLRVELSVILEDVTVRKDAAVTKKEAADCLAQLQKDVQDPAKLEAVRVLLDAAIKKYASQGKEYVAELNKVADQLTLVSLKKGLDAAKALEAQGNDRDALRACDDAVAVFSRNSARTPGKAVIDLYKETLAESDRLVDKVETPEFESGIAERDMLSPKERALWGATPDAIKHDFSDGPLRIEGTKDRVTGICSLDAPRGTEWHDLVLDLEFTIVKDGFQLFLRWEPGRKGYMLRFAPSEGYDLNKPYRMTIRIKGSTASLKASDAPENRGTLDPTTSRTGGIAFGLTNGASIIVSRCSIKFLR